MRLIDIFEEIDPSEAYRDLDGLMTIVNGKRNIGTLTLDKKNNKSIKILLKIIKDNNLNLLDIPSNKRMTIVYRDGYKNGAKELRDIAEKYGGYFHYNAEPHDVFKIGILLGYNVDSVINFIKNKKNVNT